MTLTMSIHSWLANTRFRTQAAFPARIQGESSISKPFHAARARIGTLSANHGLFTAKPSSCHAHTCSTLQVTPPTSSCPTLSTDAEPKRQHAETIFSAQCAV